jgi:hypothetical protein
VMDARDHIWAGQRQQIVISLYIVSMILKPRAPEVRLAELVALDHGAHGAVHDEDALREQCLKELSLRSIGHTELIPSSGMSRG